MAKVTQSHKVYNYVHKDLKQKTQLESINKEIAEIKAKLGQYKDNGIVQKMPAVKDSKVSVSMKPKKGYLNEEVEKMYLKIKTLKKQKIFFHQSVKSVFSNLN